MRAGRRAIHVITGYPWLVAGLAVATGAIALQVQGVATGCSTCGGWTRSVAVLMLAVVAVSVSALGFALHGVWFAWRHRDVLRVAIPAPGPPRPLGWTYACSLWRCALIVALASLAVFLPVHLISVGLAVFIAAMTVVIAASAGAFVLRPRAS